MKHTLQVAIAVILLAWFVCSASAKPEGHAIDTQKSSLRVHVSKTGAFSAFGHNHEVEAPIESGEVTEAGSPSIQLRVDARKLRVLDPKESSDTRAQIQTTMLGPQVLDSERYPQIQFRSTSVEPSGTNHWRVTGNLDLHGQMHPVTIDVTLADGTYRGSTVLKQTAFGITPVSIGGGAVKVKDELKIGFEVALAK